MAVFKCKMCGGDLNITEGTAVAVCQYCETRQTVPAANNEKKMNLFNRANRLRINSEFDMASAVYENIVAEFPEEAEAYWGLCLCNYGIEYVDDPATGRKMPTCHRASFESIENDENFKLSMEYADISARKVYRDEAKEIDRIMDEILSISKNEDPYDVFICYKETDSETGERTVDSVLAYDIYDALTAKGYKVFFSRVTLEEKLGRQYEPYIFAALNSAKVMLAVGTKYEYFHAVWVKNEWSRFLKLMAKDKEKLLIPCYKDMDAYDLPDEFRKLQAQDLGKLGAVQDIVRGIEKIIGKNPTEIKKEIPSAAPFHGINLDAIIRRAFIELEDGNFNDARANFDKALDIDGECAKAYLGLAMSEVKAGTKKDFFAEESNLSNKKYLRAKQFADGKLLDELTTLEVEAAKNRLEQKKNIEESNEKKQDKLASYRKKIEPFSKLIGAGMYHTIGLKSNGTVVATKNLVYRKYFADWTDIVDIGIGREHTIGLKNDGTVVYLGFNNYGRCNVSEWSGIVAVSTECFHTVGLKNDGTVVATKYTGEMKDYHGQCNVGSWTDIVAVSAGKNHTVGLKSNGTVVATKYTGEMKDYHGQCDVDSWTDIVAISAGVRHTVGLKSDGTVVATKYIGEIKNNAGQCNIDGWTDIVAISAGLGHTVGLKSDGTVVSTVYTGKKSSYWGQCDVSGWRDIIAVSAGWDHTVGLKKDGTLVATKYIGSKLFYNGQCDVYDWKLFDGFENFKAEQKEKISNSVKETEMQKTERRKRRLCQHCGGTFKGIFSEKCSKCGRNKDY